MSEFDVDTTEDDALLKAIGKMGHEEMSRRWRFSKFGDPIFVEGPVYDAFKARYEGFGGMTVALSNKVGWDE